MLGEAKDEIAQADEIAKGEAIDELHTQMEYDFGLSGPYEFVMPKEEGKWDSVTTNAYKVLHGKIVELLASGWMQLYIPESTDTKRGRGKISATEQLANGLIFSANRVLTAVPSGKDVQSALSWYAATLGGTCKSILLTEGDDGKISPNIRIYDPEWCRWVEGDGELLWFSFQDSLSLRDFRKRYPKASDYDASLTGNVSRKDVDVYTFFDGDEWKVACRGEWIPDSGEVHGLGRVPVNVRTCGAIPIKRSKDYADSAYKNAWMSVFHNDRGIAEMESKLLSIISSAGVESGKLKVMGEYDSNKPGNISEELAKAGYTNKGRNEMILFDVSKGEKFGGVVPPPTLEGLERALLRVIGMRTLGSIDPVAFGQMSGSGGSGALAAELRSAALEFMNPFKKCVQDDIVWIAEEGVRQFKEGSFAEMKVTGRTSKKDVFSTKLKPSDVTDEEYFECEIVPERLRDQMQEQAMAVEKIKTGLTSASTARIQHKVVADPDREEEKIIEEMVKKDPVYLNRQMALQYHKDGDEEMALYHAVLSNIRIKQVIAQGAQMGLLPNQIGGNGGGGLMPPPSAEAGRIAKEPLTSQDASMRGGVPAGFHQMPDTGAVMPDEEMPV